LTSGFEANVYFNEVSSNIGFMRGRSAVWAASLFLILALCAAVLERPAVSSRSARREVERAHFSTIVAGTANFSFESPLRSQNYFMELAGDHSLDVATVIEQPSSGYARLHVQLHLAPAPNSPWWCRLLRRPSS